MRASISQVENIYDRSIIADDEKPLREIHRRSQKAFDLNDAHALKNEIDQTFKNKIGKLSIFDQRDETSLFNYLHVDFNLNDQLLLLMKK
jgi:hypothetical protein